MAPDFERGATVLDGGGTRVAVWAPKADLLHLTVRCGADETRHPLTPGREGVHAAVVPGLGPGDDYVVHLDGGPGRPDPVSRWLPDGVHGPTRVVDPRAFRWTDGSWPGLVMAEAIIYELHVGTFTPAGTFDGVIERLPYLRDLGVTAIEIMPVAQFPGTRNWGYDGASLFAVQDSYGGPDGLRRLVNAAHGESLGVLLDVVYNHVGPEGNYLGEFGPYFSDRVKTGWGDGFNLDGPDSDEVRRFLVGNAVHWLREYHLDGLRLDAADKIVDLGALHILEEIATAAHALAAERGVPALLVAESDANDPRYLREPERGGYGLDAQWSDDFHHAVHAALTGERQGYYGDFGGTAPVARALAERFVHDGRHSAYRRRRHGRPAIDLPDDRFVVCVQNHDQVGNRARGDRLATLVAPSALRLAAAILLLPPYVPLLFMGEEYGETSPFLYFVSHSDESLMRAVREGRSREFGAFGWGGEVPDPGDPATFEASKLDWSRLGHPPHASLLRLYRDLLILRRTEPGLRPGPGAVRVTTGPDEVVSMALGSGAGAFAAYFNFSMEHADVPPTFGRSHLVLSTDDPRYGGAGASAAGSGGITLAPTSALLLRTGAA